jgi:alkylation response protein AidB-like acyl-CoA dehydrogenase
VSTTTDLPVASADDLVSAAADAAAAFAGTARNETFRERWRALTTSVILPTVDADARSSTGLGPAVRTVAAIEGMGRAGVPAGLCYALASQRFGIQFPLRDLASPVPRGLLAGMHTGATVMCHALTEEGGGSDPLSMTTVAERQPDGGYLLSGRKAFVTAAPIADHALVFARTSTGRQPFALSTFLVDLTLPGVARSTPFPKTALVEVPMGAIDFDAVRLGPGSLLGGEGAGLALLTVTTTWERALLLSYALGPMRQALDRTIDWCRSREHFGRRMGASPLVAARVADMARALFRCRRLLYDIAGRLDAGASARQLSTDAALTKISIAEDYQAFARQAAELGGVRSFVEQTGLTADLVSPAAAATYAGPNDLLRVSIARDLGLPVEN